MESAGDIIPTIIALYPIAYANESYSNLASHLLGSLVTVYGRCRIFSRSPWTSFASCCCPHCQNRANWTPLPPFLIKDYLDELLPFLLLLCNTALGDEALPASQKRALVFPSLKRNGLDADDMANYRPISNLSFLSKIVKKHVSMQLTMYLEENSLLPAQQSGFRKYHSTESLLTRILADMFLAV